MQIAAPGMYACSDEQSHVLDASASTMDSHTALGSHVAAARSYAPVTLQTASTTTGMQTAAPPAAPLTKMQVERPAMASAPDPKITAAIATIDPAHIQKIISTLVSFGTRNTLSSMATDLPAGQGINAAADWIESQYKDISTACGGCLEVKRDTFTEQPQSRIPQPTRLTNVYAILRGSDPAEAKRMYLVTGHYDSRATDVLDIHTPAPGANDDASGVAVSLESARALSKLKLPATLVFVAVAGEEQGLNGSRHLAQLAKSEGWELEGVLNNDIVGGNTTPGEPSGGANGAVGTQDKSTVRVFSEGIPATDTPEQVKQIEQLGYESDSPSRELARAIADTDRTYFSGPGAFHPTLIFRADRFLRGGDHTSFNREGFPAVRFTEWREDFNHQHQNVRLENGLQYGDLLPFVDFAYVAQVARLNAAALATLAASPGIPQEVKFEMHGLDNGSTLTWKAPAGAPADTHYELLWRETTAPAWQFMQTVPAAPGPQFTVTVPISKDNVVFAVRAVDGKGHRGLAVTP
jgi:hypothetical protein